MRKIETVYRIKQNQHDEDETDLDDKQPLGGEASDANLCISTYSTSSRTP